MIEGSKTSMKAQIYCRAKCMTLADVLSYWRTNFLLNYEASDVLELYMRIVSNRYNSVDLGILVY